MCIYLCCQFALLPSCEDPVPAAVSTRKAASYQEPEEEFRQQGCGGHPFLVNELWPQHFVQPEEGRDFTRLEFVSGSSRLLEDC